MTDFGEYFTLTNVSLKSFYKIPISLCDKNCVLLNDGSKSVVKLQDRKLLHSWTLTYPHSFTSPVVFDQNDESAYCIMDNKVFLKWSLNEDELKLKVATKAKFQESIFSILPVHQQAPLILFTSGKISSCESVDAPIGENFVSRGEQIVWAETILLNSTVKVICITFSKKNKNQLHTFSVIENNISGYHVQPLLNEADELVNYCLNRHTHSLYTIWSSGKVLSLQLDDQKLITLLTIPEAQKELLLAIDCIDSSHIVLLKSNPDLKETYLEIWDFKFTALKAKKVLKLWPVSANQISVLGTSVFLSHNEELVQVSFHAERSTLASVVGKSLAVAPKMREFSWSKGKLIKVSNSENVEEMDTSEIKEIPSNPTEYNAQRLMEEGPQFLHYVPESELVRLLRFALSFKMAGKANSSSRSKQSLNLDPDVILNAIFSTSFTDAFLVKFIKKLSLEESMAIIEVLLYFLSHQVPVSQSKPSDLQLSNWIFIVYQAHMEALLLSKDKKCMKLLKKLDDCISEMMKEYEEYDSIQNFFLVLQQEPNILPEKCTVGKYCIETLDT